MRTDVERTNICECGREKKIKATRCQACAGQENLKRWKATRKEAKKLLAEGVSPERVLEITGLSSEDSLFSRPQVFSTAPKKRGRPPKNAAPTLLEQMPTARLRWIQVRQWFENLSVKDLLSISNSEEKALVVELATLIVSEKLSSSQNVA